MIEFVVFFTAFKYVFVEGGEQALVGIGTISRIGYRQTLKITLIGITVGILLYFLFLSIIGLFPINLVEIALGIGLLYFSYTMFREFLEHGQEKDETKYRIGYLYIAILEAVENSAALATFSLIDTISAITGAILAIGVIIGLLWLGVIKRIPLKITRFFSGILLALTGFPLILYGFKVSHPEFLHYLIPPLSRI